MHHNYVEKLLSAHRFGHSIFTGDIHTQFVTQNVILTLNPSTHPWNIFFVVKRHK